MKRFALIGLLLSGCVVIDDDVPGSVYAYNGETVTIRGAFTYGEIAKPTSAMIAQAREVCPDAVYLSANSYPDDYDTFLYLFRC